MSLGRGVIYGTSKKQKLNTKSSTESELVGTDDVSPQMLWTLYFLEAQGYNIEDNLLFQDNKSSVLLETNGRGSSGKRTRHINIRYFFIADRVKSGEIKIQYCPTGIMLADYFTKPLQGIQFKKLRDMIMGNTEIVLPPDIESETANKTEEIPASPKTQEFRSVLENKIVSGNSQSLLTVLPAYGGRISRQAGKTTGIDVAAGTRAKADKRTVSWAEIASRSRE